MGRLDFLQVRILETLATVDPPWLLFGGGALLAAYADHRTTRDLDLLWTGRETLATLPATVSRCLREAGLAVEVLQSSPAFVRLRVADGAATMVVDLVSDPGAGPQELETVRIGQVTLRVPSRQELLADKLCALLSRAELRDLQDVRELLRLGADLENALCRAPRRDGGFSPLTLAWVLRGLPIPALAATLGLPSAEAEALAAFRADLVDRLVRLASA